MKKSIELSRKKSEYSVYVYGALDVRLFPNKRFNVDLKNIEIWVSHGLNHVFLGGINKVNKNDILTNHMFQLPYIWNLSH